MQHVSVRMTANGRESEIHPLYGLLANAPFVERATTLQYNYTDEELSMLHYVEGDADAMAAALGEIEAAFDFAIERVDEDEPQPGFAFFNDVSAPSPEQSAHPDRQPPSSEEPE